MMRAYFVIYLYLIFALVNNARADITSTYRKDGPAVDTYYELQVPFGPNESHQHNINCYTPNGEINHQQQQQQQQQQQHFEQPSDNVGFSTGPIGGQQQQHFEQQSDNVGFSTGGQPQHQFEQQSNNVGFSNGPTGGEQQQQHFEQQSNNVGYSTGPSNGGQSYQQSSFNTNLGLPQNLQSRLQSDDESVGQQSTNFNNQQFTQQSYGQSHTLNDHSESSQTQSNLISVGGGVGYNSQNDFNANYEDQQQGQQEPIITKHFYFHAAPEEPEQILKPKYIHLGRPQKSYNVIFIKAPAYAAKQNIIPVLPKNEDKTIVYLLSKKPEFNPHIAEVKQQEYRPTKPDVFFLKYNNAHEAERAQHQIQAAYDSGNFGVSNDAGIDPKSLSLGLQQDFEGSNGGDDGFRGRFGVGNLGGDAGGSFGGTNLGGSGGGSISSSSYSGGTSYGEADTLRGNDEGSHGVSINVNSEIGNLAGSGQSTATSFIGNDGFSSGDEQQHNPIQGGLLNDYHHTNDESSSAVDVNFISTDSGHNNGNGGGATGSYQSQRVSTPQQQSNPSSCCG